MRGPHCCARLPLSCREPGLFSSYGAGFSLWWLLLLWNRAPGHTGLSRCRTRAQELCHTGWVGSRHVGSSWTRDWTSVPCTTKADSFPVVRYSCLPSGDVLWAVLSEGVFLMYPWREMYSMSTYVSAILYSPQGRFLTPGPPGKPSSENSQGHQKGEQRALRVWTGALNETSG